MCLEWIPERVAAAAPRAAAPVNEADYTYIGVDEGRVRLFTSASSDGAITMLTRKRYYHVQKQSQQRRWEKERAAAVDVKLALESLSGSGGFKNVDLAKWSDTLATLLQHYDTIKSEYLLPKERALHRMKNFRVKRSCLSRAVRDLYEPARRQGKKIVLGVGDAKFSSTGRGEQAVPTTQMTMAFRRMKIILGADVLIRSVDEYNTTKCCHKCDSVTISPPAACHNHRRGRAKCRLCVHNDAAISEEDKIITYRASRRYRLCTTCTETYGKRRNRDVNAAFNMLKLVRCMHQGLERPAHLCRPPNPRRRR
jgi:hypothetical protein